MEGSSLLSEKGLSMHLVADKLIGRRKLREFAEITGKTLFIWASARLETQISSDSQRKKEAHNLRKFFRT